MIIRNVIIILLVAALAGCAGMATGRIAGGLSSAIANQNDPETVRAGAPAYLLLIDGLLRDNPEEEELLGAGARLYGAYAAVFVADETRARRMTEKARDYARRAVCLRAEEICAREHGPFEDFKPPLAELDHDDVPALYDYAAAWAGWIKTHSAEPDALADIPKVRACFERVIELDENFQHGEAHVYLGVIDSQLPPALGGRPETGRAHFERAIELSKGRDLIAKVEFARNYARLVFDRELHDALLGEVIAADPVEPGLTLANVLAQEQARALLEESARYFEE